MVVAFHAGLPLPGGFTGVDMFFVISGFVITNSLLSDLDASGRISFRAFYRRRARRLLPALSVVTIVTVLAAVVIQAPLGSQQTTASMARATSLFFANVTAYFQPGGYFGTSSKVDPLLHMWSLGVEEQFYLFFPLILLCCSIYARKWSLGPSRLRIAVLLIGSVGSFGLAYIATAHHEPFAFYWLPCRAWEFGVGAIVACASAQGCRLADGVTLELAALLGVACLVLSSVVIHQVSFPGLEALLPVFGAAAAISASSGKYLPIGTRILRFRPLVSVGDMSYSWYLWHWPVIVLASTAWPDESGIRIWAAIASLLPAYLSLHLLENPVRFGRLAPNTVRMGVCAMAVPVIAATALGVFSTNGWGSAKYRLYAAEAKTNTLAVRTGCLFGGTATRQQLNACVFPVPHSRGIILLVGDSHASAISSGVVAAAHQLGYSVEIRTGDACPFNFWSRLEDQELSNCGQLYAWNIQTILGRDGVKPTLVIVSQSSSARAAQLRDFGIRQPLLAWRRAMTATLATVSVADVARVVVLDVPRITSQPVPCRFGVVFALRCSVSRSWVESVQGPASAADIAAVRNVPGTILADLTSYFCNTETCSNLQHDRNMYYDNQHLNEIGSIYVEPALLHAIKQALANKK